MKQKNKSNGQIHFEKYLLKTFPQLDPSELPPVLDDIDKFVKCIQRIYTQPQVRVYYPYNKNTKQRSTNRHFRMGIEELDKVAKKEDEEPYTAKSFFDAVKEAHEEVSNKHNARRRKPV